MKNNFREEKSEMREVFCIFATTIYSLHNKERT